MRCGFLDEDKRTESMLGVFDIGEPYEPDICPGWLLRQPLILETAQAWRTFDKGNFGDFYPGASNVLCEAVLILDQSIAEHERRKREQRRDG